MRRRWCDGGRAQPDRRRGSGDAWKILLRSRGGRREIRRGRAWRGSVSGAVFEPPARVAGFHDIAVVRQAVEHGGRHFGVAEHLRPVGEGEIGRYQQRGVFIELADQMEQQLTAGLAEREIAEFVDDDEIIAQQVLR